MQLHLARDPRLAMPGGAQHTLAPLDAALLAWLALEGPTPRARLAQLLWPEKDAEAARNSLRQRLFQLHKRLGCELVTGSATLALADGVAHDLDDADTLLGEAAGEDLAPGEFAQWLALQRGRRHARVRTSLVELADMAEGAKDWDDALTHARELLALEPLSEDAHRRVIRLHYLAGDRAAALLAFDRCEQVLKDEVGARPSAETLALLATVQAAASSAEVLPPAGRVPASVLRPPRLVGRERELASVDAAWQQHRHVLVLGDAGLGKSRLLGEFLAAKPAVLRSGARPGDEQVAYATLSRLLRSLPRDALLSMPQTSRNCLASLLPDLGQPVPLHDEADRTRLFNACAQALSSAGGAVQACVIDDLQFADAASVELLRFLFETVPVRWVHASRDAEPWQPAFDWVQALSSRADTEVVRLRPLARDDVAALVDSLRLPLPPALRDADGLRRHTGGNPLFVLETVKTWIAQAGTHGVPALRPAPNALALIGQRIGRLSTEAIQLARCAAVAGPDFSGALAVQVTGKRALDLAGPWAELEAAQVFDQGVFAHDLIYEAARAPVPAPVASLLHEEIAAFLQAHDGEPARVANHWRHAQRWSQAADAYLAAARRAGDAGRDADECELLATAADCFDRAGNATARFEALLARAQRLVTKDFGAAVIEDVDRLQALARSEAQRLDVVVLRLELADNRHEHASYIEIVPQAAEAARALGRHDLAFEMALRWSAALRQLGRARECIAVLDPVRDWVAASGSVAMRWRFSSEIELVLDRCGRTQDAVNASQQTLALARETGRADWIWMTMSNAASLLGRTGRIAEACELAEQALQGAAAAGDAQRLRVVQEEVWLATRWRDLGHYARALPRLEEGLALFGSVQMVSDLALTQFRLGLLYLYLGQPARVQPLLAAPQSGLLPGIALVRGVLKGEVASWLGGDAVAPMRQALALVDDPADAFHAMGTLFAARVVGADEGEAMATAVAGRASREGRMGVAMFAHVRAAARAADQAAWRRAGVQIDSALALSADYGPDNFYLPELWCVAARVSLALGQGDVARRHVERALGWVHARLEHDVPPAFRDSFLNRNPVNRELLALKAQLAAR